MRLHKLLGNFLIKPKDKLIVENIYYLLFVCLIFWYFIYLRKVSEFARVHADKYCQQESLQFISIARRKSRLKFDKKHGPHWYSTFDFEFSGDGESRYQGVLYLRGYKLESVHLPPYKIN